MTQLNRWLNLEPKVRLSYAVGMGVLPNFPKFATIASQICYNYVL